MGYVNTHHAMFDMYLLQYLYRAIAAVTGLWTLARTRQHKLDALMFGTVCYYVCFPKEVNKSAPVPALLLSSYTKPPYSRPLQYVLNKWQR